MRIIRASEYRRMPWKNGGGETVEIAISPPGASLDAFDWRVSMAHVASSGAFSRFPGVDRTLAVLAGAGIRLSVTGHDAVTLGHDTVPFAFRGDDPASAELIDGPIDDLNAMTRRTTYRHRLARIPAAAPVRVRREGDILLVMAREAATALAGGAQHALAAGDTILLDHEPEFEIEPAAPAEVYAIDLWRV
jgi:environmental stress-induced protein Ves